MRRTDRILSIVAALKAQGVPDYALDPIHEYVEGIRYCECGHKDAGTHGNGIVDRRCHAKGCGCQRFTPEAVSVGG